MSAPVRPQREIDWTELRIAAIDVARRAWAPYSGLRVGAAGATESGLVVVGCNVENASYGLSLCAECGLISSLHQHAAGRLTGVCIVDGRGQFLMPCGRCRQLLFEAGGPELLVDASPGPVRLESLLPNAFGPADLPTKTPRNL